MRARTRRSSVRGKDAVVPYLEEQERRAEHLGRPGHVKNELVESRERRLQRVPEVLEPDVRVGLDEQHALAGALDGELAALELPEPPGERVVVHERAGHGVADHGRWVPRAHERAAAVELDDGDVEPQPVLVVDVRQPLELARRRLRRLHQRRGLPPHRELERRHCFACQVGQGRRRR
jgi:hypothetical protein